MIYRYFLFAFFTWLFSNLINTSKHQLLSFVQVPLFPVNIFDTRGQWLYMWRAQRLHASSAVIPRDSLAAVNDEELSCLQLTLHTSSLQRSEQAKLNPLHYRHFSFPPTHTHTIHTSPTHENKQSSFKPAAFASAEGVMESIFWELCCVWNVIMPNWKQGLPFLSFQHLEMVA